MKIYHICMIVILCSTELCAKVEDKMEYIENDAIKVGVNLSAGGAITYVSQINGRNMINSYDWGRQIQQSYYSGPDNYTREGKEKSEDWSMFPWNPIQAGDCYGNGAKVLDLKKTDESLYIKTLPMLWPMKDDPGECYFETWIKLKDNTFSYRAKLTNNRSDKTLYHAFAQEIPAIYTNGIWHNLYTYTGSKPYTDDSVTDVFADSIEMWPWLNFISTENWIALVDDKGIGIGVVIPSTMHVLGGFAGERGQGGEKDSPTGYISPLRTDILDHDVKYEYKCTFVVGSVDEIRKVAKKSASKKLPSWNFRKDRQNWYYENGADTGWPIKNGLHIKPYENNTIRVISPISYWKAESAPIIAVKAAVSKDLDLDVILRWRGMTPKPILTNKEWGEWSGAWWTSERSSSFKITGYGEPHWYYIDASKSALYKDEITGIAFDIPYFQESKEFIIYEVKLMESMGKSQ